MQAAQQIALVLPAKVELAATLRERLRRGRNDRVLDGGRQVITPELPTGCDLFQGEIAQGRFKHRHRRVHHFGQVRAHRLRIDDGLSVTGSESPCLHVEVGLDAGVHRML
ncbi:hypothetical protein D3C80_1506110 [compost metagenome]